MAVQKLHEFCEAEKRKIFAVRKIIVQGELSKKFNRLAKYIYYIEISLNTSFFKELIPKQQRKKHVH
jgi:glutaredoxin 2